MMNRKIGIPDALESNHGWPWEQENEAPSFDEDRGLAWPKISVVTPSFNQGEFLEQTIRSVLMQNYPNLEYIVIDGGSTDNSVDILKHYSSHLTFWQSAADHGQTEALNKGFSMATGEIVGWLNSDDIYVPDTFSLVLKNVSELRQYGLVSGDSIMCSQRGAGVFTARASVQLLPLFLHAYRQASGNNLVKAVMPCQPTVFWHKRVFEKLGLLDESLEYAMDYDYWLRALAAGFKFHAINEVLAVNRYHDAAKTYLGWDVFLPEWTAVANKHLVNLPSHIKIIVNGCRRVLDIIWHFLRVLSRYKHRFIGSGKT